MVERRSRSAAAASHASVASSSSLACVVRSLGSACWRSLRTTLVEWSIPVYADASATVRLDRLGRVRPMTTRPLRWPTIELDRVTKVYGERLRRRRRRQPRDPRRRVHRPRRPVRLRQVDAAAHDRRARGGDRGRDPDRRPRRDRPRAAPPRHRDGLPELRALPAHDRAPEPRLRAEGARRRRRRDRGAGRRGRASCSGLDELLDRQARRSSPAASASASRWAARSCASRRRS